MKRSASPIACCYWLGALLFAGLQLTPAAVSAATLTVNALDDTWSGGCDAAHCSLREAIWDAGSNDTINFDFTGVLLPSTAPVINLWTTLPPIDASGLTIDGYDCTSCGPVAENTADPADGLNMQVGPTIDGQNMVSWWALIEVAADDVTLRGLNLVNSSGAAIHANGNSADRLVVEGCIIGLARDGVTPAGNAGAGISLERGDNPVIGPYNVISGNGGAGIEIVGNRPDDGGIFGNLIGTDITGALGRGNGGSGIAAMALSSSGSSAQIGWVIGSAQPADQNVISGNGGYGIYMERRVRDFDIVGNIIGLSGDQTSPLGNGGDGVRMVGVSGGDNYPRDSAFEDNVISANGGSGLYCHACKAQSVYRNYIGTNEAGDSGLGNTEEGIYLYGGYYHNTEDWVIGSGSVADANVVAHNGGNGIRLRRGVTGSGTKESRRHSVGINEFYSNGGLAIELEGASTGAGPLSPTTTSCSNDNSLGNRGAARPEIDSVEILAGQLEVSGTACNSVTVMVFVAEPDPSGYGEPTTYLGTVQADSSGVWSYSQLAGGVGSGDFITAYSEDGDGETGEAAANVEIIGCDDDSDGFDSLACGGLDCDDGNAAINPGEIEVCDGLDNDCSGSVPGDEVDADVDGVMECAGDCDDGNAAINPGEIEICDGLDNDCSGSVPGDEVDVDGDGVMVCAGDCDDGNAAMNPSLSEVCDGLDNDCSGSVPGDEVDVDGDGVMICAGDCDDGNAAMNPGETEICDGLDNDCSGSVPGDEVDVDGDGVMVCAGDCDDGNAAVYPGATEICDGLDNDCDGLVSGDEMDVDGDGLMECAGDCDDGNAAINPSLPEVCDGLDNDCSGSVPGDELDADGDGVMGCAGDCDDGNAAVNPGATEVCDGLDNDCDGALGADELDGDGDGVTVCDGDCDANDNTIYLGAPEVCADGVDQDCDGADAVGADSDGDGHTDCLGDCDDAEATVYPGAPEICDGLDNDCDGFLAADELDGDGDGYTGCDGDCDDSDDSVHPGAIEICADGIDQDCDGADTGLEDLDGDGYSACVDCDDSNDAVFPSAPELCDGLDNDCDGSLGIGEVDVDGDGFRVCDGDCDDAAPAIYPGAEELCADDIDSDCDGALDPDDMDVDDDGFDMESCGGSDCDDAEGAVNPGAEEICEDGVDNDCSGIDADCLTMGGTMPLVAGGGCSSCDLADPGGRPTGRALWLGLFLVGGLFRRRSR